VERRENPLNAPSPVEQHFLEAVKEIKQIEKSKKQKQAGEET